MGEAINLVENFKVENVIFNCGKYNDLEKELIKVLEKKNIMYYSCIKELNIDKYKLEFLQTKLYDNEIDNSNVIYTELNGYKFMFMGDASISTEKEILSKYNLPNIDVLKVGHRGSNTSSGKEFINEINPKYSIISVGKNNRYGHPKEEVLETLKNSKIYRTDLDGSKEYTEKMFEDIKRIDENGNEFWYAREFQYVLNYSQWRRFENVIDKAKVSCNNSKINVEEQFANVGKLSKRSNNAVVEIDDYKLSRYACYLIAQNGDSRKKVIALAQTYFAIQTRKQELSEKEYDKLTEDEKRIYRRNQAKSGNYNLNKTAIKSDVKDLARFHNAGYKGLYNGETANDIFKRKKLRYREDILDNMGSEELADNIFRIAQTDAKLKRDNVDNEYTANSVHYEV